MNMILRSREWLLVNWRWLLVLSVLPLFADNALYNAPLLILALLGLRTLVKQGRVLLQQPGIRWLLSGFAALWLPQVIALVDAADPGHSMKTVLSYPAYMLAVLYIATALNSKDLLRLGYGILAVMAVWILDALLGWTGFEAWLGHTAAGVQITGMLFSKLTLGHIVAVLSPLVFDYLRRHVRSPWAWLLLIGVVLVVLLSGRRVSWMMLGVAGMGYLFYMICILHTARLKVTGAAVLIALIVPAVLYTQYQPFQNRIDVTLGLFSSSSQTVDKATAHRLDIWANAASIATTHWFNGVGPRGFRHVYEEFAGRHDYWAGRNISPTHPHQFMLEIAAETGSIGIIGYILFWLMLFYALRNKTLTTTVPLALAVGVALFPLNAHLAFYGSYWTAFVWWLIGILFAAIRINAENEQPRTLRPASDRPA